MYAMQCQVCQISSHEYLPKKFSAAWGHYNSACRETVWTIELVSEDGWTPGSKYLVYEWLWPLRDKWTPCLQRFRTQLMKTYVAETSCNQFGMIRLIATHMLIEICSLVDHEVFQGRIFVPSIWTI